MLFMSASGGERDFHIGDRRTGKHAAMCFFRKMRQNEPLPVARQLALRQVACKMQTAAAFGRFENQMHLAVMP